MQAGDRRVGPLDRLVPLVDRGRAGPTEQEADLGAEAGRQRPAGGDGRPTERLARRRRPEERDRRERRRRGEPPAGQAVRDRGDGTGERDRQDEGEEQRHGGAREHGADDAREEDAEAHEPHREGAEPGRARHDRADADEDRAGRRERRLRLQPCAHRAAEVDEQQQRERPEGGEGGDRGVPQHLGAEGEHGGHDEGAAAGPAQRSHPGVLRPEPPQRVHRFPHPPTSISGRRDRV